ncbi:hypothetical protein KCU85_g4689, partial [Aureobasidium melanogenum]
MPLFAGLPPELRVMIYMHLLQDGLASGKRIVYYHKDDQHNKSNSPSEEHMSANLQPECGAVGWSRSAMKYEMNHQRRITSLVNGHNRYGPDVQKRVICHADIDALLSLANTCRQIRAEVLYIAWSNGKITIYAPDDRFKDDVFHIFGHCLSVEVCRMIRHLNIDIGKVNWSASYAHQTAHFIIKRLPNLEKLNICVARDDTEDPEPDIGDGLRAITCLPLRIFVQIKVYIHPSIANQQPLPRLVETITSWNYNLYFEALRTRTLIRAAYRAQNEERHVDGSLLEDTLGMRSWMAGWPVISSQTAPKERWEVRNHGHWRNGWKVREGVEDAVRETRFTYGPWSERMYELYKRRCVGQEHAE